MQYLTYISINVPSINQFHSKTSELLSEKKPLIQSFNLIVDAARLPAIPTNANLLAVRWKIRLKSNKSHCLDLSSLSKPWKRNYLETMSLSCKLDSMVCVNIRPLKEQMHPNCITLYLILNKHMITLFIIIIIRTITIIIWIYIWIYTCSTY